MHCESKLPVEYNMFYCQLVLAILVINLVEELSAIKDHSLKLRHIHISKPASNCMFTAVKSFAYKLLHKNDLQ